MKATQLREESVARLREMCEEMRKGLFDLRKGLAAAETAVNPHAVKQMRRDIARVVTIVHAVELVTEKTGLDDEAAKKLLQDCRWDIEAAVARTGNQEKTGS